MLDDRRLRLIAPIIAGLAVVARVWVSWTTHSTAEDFLITLRYAENIAAGRGFVFNPGEHVLGSTTPLYTLILALAAWLHLPDALAGKALNILADGVTCYLLARLLARPEIGQPIAGLFAALLYAFSSTPINISIGGMESSLVTCVSLGMIYAYVARRSRALYLLGAILFLLRIDGLLLFALLAVGLVIRERRIPWRDLGLAVLVALPWILFATVYFGSPVPTSLVAKLIVYANGVTPRWVNTGAFVTQFAAGWFQRLVTLLFLLGAARIVLYLRPHPLATSPRDPASRAGEGETAPGRERPVWQATNVANRPHGRTKPEEEQRREEQNLPSPKIGREVGGEGLSSTPYTLHPTPSPSRKNVGVLAVPLVWLLLYYGTMFTSHVPAFAWYFLPPWPLFLGIAALGAGWMAEWVGGLLPRSAGSSIYRAWPLGLLAFGLFGAAHLRAIRADIARTQWVEDSLRVPIGLWLHDHARPNERILLEPIGYVGYYSQRPILDMIGLVSPEVFPSYHTPHALFDIVRRLRPDWLCLRPGERDILVQQGMPLDGSRAEYAYVREFHVPGRGPGFLLYHRRQDFSPSVAQ